MKLTEKLEFSIAVPEQSEELSDLINSVYRGENSRKGWTTEADILGGIRINKEKVKEIIESTEQIIITAHLNEKIIGCVNIEKREGYCYWGMLSVDVNYQTLGLGKTLINKCESYAKDVLKCNEVRIQVLHVRKELIDYYIRRGYKLLDEKKSFNGPDIFGEPKLKEPLHFVVMSKKLDKTVNF